MPEEIVIIKDQIRSKESYIDSLTRDLKDMDTADARYAKFWDRRVVAKEELEVLLKQDNY